jgi:hypothetical protein
MLYQRVNLRQKAELIEDTKHNGVVDTKGICIRLGIISPLWIAVIRNKVIVSCSKTVPCARTRAGFGGLDH